MISSEVKCECGATIHIEDACTRLDVKTNVREFTCNRCSDWYHNFGNDNIGSCSVCNRNISKKTAVHHEVNDENGNLSWGYFTCKEKEG